MARTPTVYRWDDAGAPDINALMPSNNDKYKMWMYHILKACLVDGYGSKVAAGWTMPLEEITDTGCRFTLENAAKTGVLLYEGGSFSGGSTNLATNTIWACEAAAGLSSPVNAWSGSVPYAERETSTESMLRVPGNMHRWTHWIVVANENTVIVFMPGSNGVDFDITTTSGPSNYQCSRLMFGVMHDSMGLGGVSDPKPGNFFIVGGVFRSGYASYATNYSFNFSAATTATDLVGGGKAAKHTYVGGIDRAQDAYSAPNAWITEAMTFFGYGPSGPDGNSSNNTYHQFDVVGMRTLSFRPASLTYCNAWFNEEGWDYGVPFDLGGRSWFVVKSPAWVVEVVSLDPTEWGA